MVQASAQGTLGQAEPATQQSASIARGRARASLSLDVVTGPEPHGTPSPYSQSPEGIR